MRSGRKRLRVSAPLEVPPTPDDTEGCRASEGNYRKRAPTMADPDRVKARPGRTMSTVAFLWCLDVLDRLMRDPAVRAFDELRGRSGGSRVPKLMDLALVKCNLEEGDYVSADEFAEDVVLTLKTAVELGSPSVSGVLGMFEKEWRQFRESLEPKKSNVKDRAAESVSSGLLSATTHRSRSDAQKAAAIRRSVETISDRWYPATSTKSSVTSTSSLSSIERPEYRSIDSATQLRRGSSIEPQREAARRKIAAMKNTAGLTDNFESMIEFNKLLKGKSWSAQYVPCWSRAGYQLIV